MINLATQAPVIPGPRYDNAFWIVKGAAAVRHSIGQCIKCKRRNASVGKQLMADLPRCRVQTDKPPFYKVGVATLALFWLSSEEAGLKDMDEYFHA